MVYFGIYQPLRLITKEILNILGVLYVDRICTEDHFVENRIKIFPSVQKLQWFIYDTFLFSTESNLPWIVYWFRSTTQHSLILNFKLNFRWWYSTFSLMLYTFHINFLHWSFLTIHYITGKFNFKTETVIWILNKILKCLKLHNNLFKFIW